MKDMYTEMLKDGINIKNPKELEEILSRFEKVGIIISDNEVGSFIGKNGKEVKVEYNAETHKLSLNTSWLDQVADFDLPGISDDIDTKEKAKTYIKEQIKTLKKYYDGIDKKDKNYVYGGEDPKDGLL